MAKPATTTTPTRPVPGRSPPGPHQPALIDAIRSRILSGRYGALDRLPTVRELSREFGSSPLTIHRSLRTLADWGFIEARGRLGTRVVEHPPHRHRFGLVLPGRPDGEGRYANLSWQAMAEAAAGRPVGTARSVEVFHGLGDHPDLPEHQRLLHALQQRRLAGLILFGAVELGPWFDPASIPMPIMGAPTPPGHHPRFGKLLLLRRTFLARALDRVRDQGCKRVAAILDADPGAADQVDLLTAMAAERGLSCPIHHILAAPLAAPGWARHAVRGMFTAPQPHPEALIIGDDNLLSPILDGLIAQGAPATGTLLVSLANFPLRQHPALPVVALGWDHREYLDRAMDRLDRWNRSGKPVGLTELPVRSATEIGESAPTPIAPRQQP